MALARRGLAHTGAQGRPGRRKLAASEAKTGGTSPLLNYLLGP